MADNENTTIDDDKFLAERPRRKRRRPQDFGYLYLFIIIFACAFYAMNKTIEMYSPDADVQIGNRQEITLNDDDMNFEARPIDERLKWIQMEDDIPAAGKHGIYKDDTVWKRFTANETVKQTAVPDKKTPEENGFKNIPPAHDNDPVIQSLLKEKQIKHSEEKTPSAKEETKQKEKAAKNEGQDISVSITRVYAGTYATSEEALAAQKKLSAADPSVTPFIKNRNGKYTIQAGSFYDAEKADALVKKLNADGFQAKKVTDK